MGFTQQDLDKFHRFAVEKISDGVADLCLEECLRLWRAERENAETIACIRQGEQDMEAGRYRTMDEVDAEIRERFDRIVSEIE